MNINIYLGDGECYEGNAEFQPEVLDSSNVVNIEYKCSAKKKDQDFFLDCEYTARMFFPCARCLRDTEYQTKGNIYVHCSQRALDDEEEYVLRIHKGSVDLAEPILQDIILTMPSVHICSEDCEGICGTCFNYKPCDCVKENEPFGALKKLFEQNKEE